MVCRVQKRPLLLCRVPESGLEDLQEVLSGQVGEAIAKHSLAFRWRYGELPLLIT
jgi:hypothetical protein